MSGKKKVLVIEDEANVCELIKVNLELEGYEAECAFDGDVGLEKVMAVNPDLVVLDIFMPNLDGWEVCRRIKADAKTRDIPVIMLTISSDVEKGLACGADAYITKPFLIEDLMYHVERLCG